MQSAERLPATDTFPAPVRGASRPVAPALRAPSPWPDRIAAGLLLGACIGATAAHLSYYLAPRAVRLRDPLHALLRPSGAVGLGFGIAAFALFLFVWLYPLRKKFSRALGWTGRLPSWLRAHVVAGLCLPVLAAVHAGWRFEGVIGLGYWAMVVVWASGLVGRYLYAHIPHTRSGIEMTLDEVRGERRGLLTRLAVETGIEPLEVERALTLKDRSGTGTWASLQRLVLGDLDRRRALGRVSRMWSRPAPGRPPLDRRKLRQALALARREITLAQQMQTLEGTRRLFALWHVAHRPFAITALLAVVLHVAVAFWLGAVSWN